MSANPFSPPTLRASYDELPYVRRPHPQSHPERLATIALLFGVTPPPLATARVLELGCAAGDNLIPMAMQLPQAQFVGVDFSPRQIAVGRGMIADLQLGNIELREADIVAVDATWGKFDYIVCHGIYSWVPAPIRARILAICRDHLAPRGVAYVSYNALPGWRTRETVRDMMLYHTEQLTDAASKVEQARSIIGFLAENAVADPPHYAMALKSEADSLRKAADAYVFHDHLEPVNEAFYFHQFAQAAREHGLVYLAEASFRDMMVTNLPAPVIETLTRIAPDIIRLEQYMDFVRNRMFRQTLLVHDDVVVNRRLGWQPLRGMFFVGVAEPMDRAPRLDSDAPHSFRTAEGSIFTASNPLTKAALLLLWERRPQALAFADLLAEAQAMRAAGTGTHKGADGTAQDAATLGATLLHCYGAGWVEVRSWAPPFCVTPSARPQASPIARLQAKGDGLVTNLRHERVSLDTFARVVLQLLDGTRDHAALVAAVTSDAQRRADSLRQRGTEPVAAGPELGEALARSLDACLLKLGRAALLCD